MKKYLLLLVYVMASFICLSQSGYYYDGNFISFEAQDSTKCYVIVNESNVDSFEKQNRGKYVKIRDTEYMIEKSNLMNNDLITYVSNIYSTSIFINAQFL